MHAQRLPIAMPALSAPAFTFAGSMWDGSSTGISTVSNPHFLNWEKSFVLAVTNGLTKRKELMPKRIRCVGVSAGGAAFCAGADVESRRAIPPNAKSVANAVWQAKKSRISDPMNQQTSRVLI